MNVSRGDLCLIEFPYSDGSRSKYRPALVVQCDANNRRLNSTIVVLITKNVSRVAWAATQFLVTADSIEGRAAGLRFDSAVDCANLFTAHESLIRKRIGRMPPDLMKAVDECLRRSLGVDG